MLRNHPTAEEFEGFLRGVSGPGAAARNARVLRHLLADCSPCRSQLHTMGWSDQRLERLFRFPVDRQEEPVEQTAAASPYNRTFAAVEQALAAFFATEKPAEATAEELLVELAPLPQEEQERRVRTASRFAHPELVRKLAEMSHAVRYENAARMLHLSHLAMLAAEACTVPHAGNAAKLADLRALGWRQYANALRVSGRLPEAEDAFEMAQRFCSEGTGDPLLRAAILERLVSLRYFQRRFEEAIELADDAGRLYSEIGESRSVASTMVQKAIAQIYAGELDAAVPTLNRAIPLIDHEGDPHLLLAACHNLIRCYTDLGQPEQALSLYFEIRGLYRDFQDPLIALRTGWQEGQILRDLGHLAAAEAALATARHGFLERELLYEVALVSLDLSDVYVRRGEAVKLQEAVAEMVPIFKSLGVDREALAALLQLQQAHHQSRQGLELIKYLSSRLEQLPHRQMP